MASFNGNIGTPSGGFNLKVEYSISQSVSGNYSDVTATGYVKRNNSSYRPYNSSSSASLTINGTSKSYTGSYDLRSDGYKTITSNTVRVYHNNDGTKSITISFSFNGKLSNYYPNGSISQTITLPSIPRQANISTAPDFNDEENPTITYSNPAGNSVSSLDACISLTGSNDDVPYRSINKTGTLSYTFDLTEEERNILRQATTTSNSRTIYFFIKTIIGGVTYFSKIAKTFTIINANPIFNDFTFEDINEQTLLLTGDNQSVIAGCSDVKVTIPVSNKATAIKQATMSKYRFNSIDANYSETEDVSITSNAVTSGDFTVYAIDSRGNSKPVTKNAINVVNYTPLQKGNITVSRENGVSENVVLKFDATIDLVDFGAKINSVTSAQYRYKVASETEWSELKNITVQVDDNGKITFNSLIEGDTETLGFNIQNAYNIEVYLKDELSEVKYIANFGAGIPHIAYAKNGVGIMGAYNESVGGLLQVGGKKFTNEETYSIEEQKVGTWIDGRPIYRKVIDLGTLPNNSSKYVETGLIHTNIRVIRLYGNACNASGSYQSGLNDIYSRLNLVSDNTLGIQTTINFSSFTGYAILEYTKTTD